MEWEDLEARIQAFLGSDLADEPVACTAARDLLRGAMTELEKRQEEIMEAARFGQQLLRQLQSATSTDDQAADEKRQTALQIKVLQHKLRSAEQDAEALATDHESLKTQLAANETFLSVERQRCKRLEKRAAELEEECQEVEATATFLRTENIELSVALQHYERQIEQLQKCIEDLSSMSTPTFGLSQDADRPKSKKDKRRVSIEGATKPRRRTTLGGTSDIASATQSREPRDPKGMSSPDVPLKPILSGSTTEATTDPGTGGTTPWAERDQFRAPSTRSFASEDDVLDSSRFHDYAPVPLSARFGSPPCPSGTHPTVGTSSAPAPGKRRARAFGSSSASSGRSRFLAKCSESARPSRPPSGAPSPSLAHQHPTTRHHRRGAAARRRLGGPSATRRSRWLSGPSGQRSSFFLTSSSLVNSTHGRSTRCRGHCSSSCPTNGDNRCTQRHPAVCLSSCKTRPSSSGSFCQGPRKHLKAIGTGHGRRHNRRRLQTPGAGSHDLCNVPTRRRASGSAAVCQSLASSSFPVFFTFLARPSRKRRRCPGPVRGPLDKPGRRRGHRSVGPRRPERGGVARDAKPTTTRRPRPQRRRSDGTRWPT